MKIKNLVVVSSEYPPPPKSLKLVNLLGDPSNVISVKERYEKREKKIQKTKKKWMVPEIMGDT